MATSQLSEVIQLLRRTVLLRDGAGRTDGQLLEDYISRREEAALEALVRRHAPMVWGVCRRVLGNHHDAEDAFQATFLILVRKAASIASPKLLANWLYGVAHQTALKARATTTKRKARERQVTQMPEPAVTERDLWHDLQPLLDQELKRLPDIYRVAIVLCDLEGKTRKEAARQLGVPEGTLAARVARGRVMLAKRLARHGVAVSGGALGTMLAQNAASAGVPTLVVTSTIKAASLFAAGQTAAAGLISAKAAALTEGVLQTMLLSKIKVAMAVVLVVAAVGVGGNRLLLPIRAADGADGPTPVQPDKPQPNPQKGKPRIEVIGVRVHEFEVQVLFVRDPSSGKFKPLSRDDGIPVVKEYIGYHVKNLKDAKDDKGVHEALKGLEESLQNLKDLLGYPDVPLEKKPEDKKPAKEKPPADTTLPLDKVADRLGLAGELAKVNAVDARDLRAQLIRIVRDFIERDVRTLNEAKDEKSKRQALRTLEESAQNMKELLSLPGAPAEKKPAKEKPPLKLGAAAEPERDTEPLQILVSFSHSDKDTPSMRFMTASRMELTRADISSSELRAKGRWRELPPAQTTGATIPLTTADLPKEKLQAHRRFHRTVTREEAIPIVKNYIDLDMKKLTEAKDDKSMRQAVEDLVKSVQMLKQLLSFGVPAAKKP